MYRRQNSSYSMSRGCGTKAHGLRTRRRSPHPPPQTLVIGITPAVPQAMALGPEPATRACPKCQAPCRADAQRCGFCWELLPARAGASATASAVSA